MESRHHVLAPGDLVSFGERVFRIECDPVQPNASPLLVDALAAQLARRSLPRETTAIEGVELFAESRAAYRVGCDFHDVFWVTRERLAVFVGDISGKGIAGPVLMATIANDLRSAALTHVEPDAVLAAMNEVAIAYDQPELSFTTIYFTLDVNTGEVALANAGHPAPYWRHESGMLAAITAGRGCAMGIRDEPAVDVTSLLLDEGDALVVYTDGLVEAAGADGTLYGRARLEAWLKGTEKRLNVIAEEIFRSVAEHSAPAAPSDDLTLFICRRSGGTALASESRREHEGRDHLRQRARSLEQPQGGSLHRAGAAHSTPPGRTVDLGRRHG